MQFLSTNNEKLWISRTLIAFFKSYWFRNIENIKLQNYTLITKFYYVLLINIKILKHVLFWNRRNIIFYKIYLGYIKISSNKTNITNENILLYNW